MHKPNKAGLLFHTGLLLFSIAPALIVLLLLLVTGIGSALSLAAALITITLFQIYGFLYTNGVTDNPMPLRLSFWTLKVLQSIHTLPHHTPEKMVVAMNNRKALSEADGIFSSDEVLILVPHCLQNHECPIRLTFDPDSCERCGKCHIGNLLDI